MEKKVLRNVAAWLLSLVCFFCYMPTSVFADEEVTYNEATDTVTDVNYQKILGDAMEYGVVADTYRQSNHAQTNFAANEYVRGGDEVLEADLMGKGNIPFLIGKMENKIRFGQHTYNNENVTMDVVTSDKYDDSVFLRDNRDRVAVNATYESEDSVRNRVAKLQNHVAEWSKKLAAKKATVVLPENMRSNTINLTRYDNNAVIYVAVPENGNFLTEVINHNLTIQKKSNQIVVFNIPNKEISLKDFTVISDGETVRSQTSQSDTNQKADEEILRKVIWNMPNAEKVNLKDNAGMFLVPKDTATINMDGGAVGGWLVTGGTLNGSAEWHFMFQARQYNNKPSEPVEEDSTVSTSFQGTKILKGRTLKADEFTFHVTSDDANAPMPEKTEVKNDADGHICFGDITFKNADLGDKTEKTFTYHVSESGTQPGVTNDPEAKTVKVTVKKDSTGKLTAETEGEGESLFTFTNTYHEDNDGNDDNGGNNGNNNAVASVSVNPSVTKKIVGDTPEQKEIFCFALTGISVDGDADKMPPMPADAKDGTKTVTVEGEGTQTFGEITFDKAGTYCYQVIEGTGENSDYTYDTTIYELTYVVTSKDGKLVAEESIQTQGDKASEKATAESLTFTNKYTKPHNDGDGSNGNGNNGGNGGNQGDNGNGSNGGDNGTTGNTGNNGNGGNNGSTGSTSSTKKSTSSTGSSHRGSGKTATQVSSHSHVPNTGDTSETGMLLGIMGIAAVMLAVVTVLRKKLMLRK
ncbi:MAG: FctA domain-containing protein [Eubacteriales bacterium]|nr:FctA domain-containing protein [Eubacteriales bacterium]